MLYLITRILKSFSSKAVSIFFYMNSHFEPTATAVPGYQQDVPQVGQAEPSRAKMRNFEFVSSDKFEQRNPEKLVDNLNFSLFERTQKRTTNITFTNLVSPSAFRMKKV